MEISVQCCMNTVTKIINKMFLTDFNFQSTSKLAQADTSAYCNIQEHKSNFCTPSISHILCKCKHTHTHSYHRSFAAASPLDWTRPGSLHLKGNCTCYRHLVRSHLFDLQLHLVNCSEAPCKNALTYLETIIDSVTAA